MSDSTRQRKTELAGTIRQEWLDDTCAMIDGTMSGLWGAARRLREAVAAHETPPRDVIMAAVDAIDAAAWSAGMSVNARWHVVNTTMRGLRLPDGYRVFGASAGGLFASRSEAIDWGVFDPWDENAHDPWSVKA